MGGQSHTAGEWRATAGNGGFVHSIDDGRQALVASVYPCAPDGHPPLTSYPREPEMEANARLIAASPELLEALKPFAAVLADVGSDEDDQDLYSAMSRAHRTVPALTIGHLRAAFSAIAKASGEQPQ